MKYGFSYLGSKSKIANDIINFLPKADNLYDLFAGGGAITHCALLSGKWKHIIANDIQGTMSLFLDAVNGKYKDEKRWISREQFKAEKDKDQYIRWIWSFGNNGKTYLFNKDIEEYKKFFHQVVVEGIDKTKEMSEFAEKYVFDKYGIKEKCEIKMPRSDNLKERRLEVRRQLSNFAKKCKLNQLHCLERLEVLERLQRLQGLQQLDQLQRLQQLERLQRLQGLQQLDQLHCLERLEVFAKDYREIEIKPNSVIYCDIPYNQKIIKSKQKEKYYDIDFNISDFYIWAKKQKVPVYFSSCFCEDDYFKEVWSKKKLCGINNNVMADKKLIIEKIYWNNVGLE